MRCSSIRSGPSSPPLRSTARAAGPPSLGRAEEVAGAIVGAAAGAITGYREGGVRGAAAGAVVGSAFGAAAPWAAAQASTVAGRVAAFTATNASGGAISAGTAGVVETGSVSSVPPAAFAAGAFTSALAPFLTGEAALTGAGLASRTVLGRLGEALPGVYSAATGNALNAVLAPGPQPGLAISPNSAVSSIVQGGDLGFNPAGSGLYIGAEIQIRMRK